MPSLLEPAWAGFCAVIGGDGGEFILLTRWAATAAGCPAGWYLTMWWLALAHDSGYERVATPGCSGCTIQRRLAEWSELDAAETLGGRATALVDERLRQDPPDDRPQCHRI